MNGQKSWYKSVTMQASIVLLILAGRQFFGVEVEGLEVEDVLDKGETFYSAGLAFFFSLAALWGRLRARKELV